METGDRLAKLAKEVSTLKSQMAKEQGQLEALKSQRASLEEECQKLGIEPGKLSEITSQKQLRLQELLNLLDSQLDKIEQDRKAILGGESF